MFSLSVDYFLGSTSHSGFYSYYREFLDSHDIHKQYYIKSSPGSGKSSFMRRVAKGLDGEMQYVRCSSDPKSLDGVVFKNYNTAIVDATAPHVMEPLYHNAVGEYLHLGEFVDSTHLIAKLDEIKVCTGIGKSAYLRAYKCLSAARSVQEEISSLALETDGLQGVSKRVKGIIRRELTKPENKERKQLIQKCFLSSHTFDGELCLWGTVTELCEKVYVIEDSFFFSPAFMSAIYLACLQNNLDMLACYSPIDPEGRIEHILIPELSLAFVTSRPGCVCPLTPYRRVRLDIYVGNEWLDTQRGRLRFLRKMERALMEEAFQNLEDAKKAHDELEKLYNPHVNFESVYAVADKLTEKIKLP